MGTMQGAFLVMGVISVVGAAVCGLMLARRLQPETVPGLA
jgi:hypothetical protein